MAQWRSRLADSAGGQPMTAFEAHKRRLRGRGSRRGLLAARADLISRHFRAGG